MTIGARVMLAAAVLTGTVSTQEWYPEDPAIPPPARRFHGLVFDSARGVTVLFGGVDEPRDAVHGDTWEYDGGEWLLRATDGPGPRERFAVCYDSARGVVLLFGGADAQGSPLADTWAWDGSTWRQVPTQNAPSPRLGMQMVFDGARGRAVLFGGRDGDAGAPFGDTWEFDGTDWTRRSPSDAPAPRHGHAMAFDDLRGVTVLFGGFADGASATATDTWEWDGSDWREITTATPPAASIFPAMTFHSGHGVAVLTGAVGTFAPPVRTFAFDGVDWHPGPVAPAALRGRQGHAIAYDAARDAVVLFGGAGIGFGGALPLDDTWEMSERASVEPFGTGCGTPDGVLQLGTRDAQRPELGRTLVLEAGPTNGASVAGLLFGVSDTTWGSIPLPFDLTPVGMPGCQLFVAIEALEPMLPGRTSAAYALPVPLRTDLLGRNLLVQAVVVDGLGLRAPFAVTSNALRLRFGN